jgi:tRNA-specific adenosine deaminase 1
MSNLSSEIIQTWTGGYYYRNFNVVNTAIEFEFSRRAIENCAKYVPSNISAIWCPYQQEVLAGGIRQGRKKMDPHGASGISRLRMWEAVMNTFKCLNGANGVSELAGASTYKHIKEHKLLEHRRMVKATVTSALRGWVSNGGDDQFSLNEKAKAQSGIYS